jgi:hypothetical protein
VHRVPNGAEIDGKGNVFVKGALLEAGTECNYPRIGATQIKGKESGTDANIPSNPGGGVNQLWSYETAPGNGQVWTALEGAAQVPSYGPTSSDGQIDFYWQGFQATDGSWLLQPVLQWGTSDIGGGPYWAMASWLVGGNQTWGTSDLIPVNPNDQLYFYTEDTGSIPDSNDDQMVAELLDSTQGTYTTLITHLNAGFWTSPGLIAVGGALEYNNAPNCGGDIPYILFNIVLPFAGTVHPPTYNELSFFPNGHVRNFLTNPHCRGSFCDPSTYPCFGLSGGATLIGP